MLLLLPACSKRNFKAVVYIKTVVYVPVSNLQEVLQTILLFREFSIKLLLALHV